MKKIYMLLILLVPCIKAMAQQEEQFTQFMYNKLWLNPAYAGSSDGPTVTILGRSQWMGIEGAPQTQMITGNIPLVNQKVGVGLSIARQTIGLSNSFTFETDYAYRLRMGAGFLSMGVSASVRLLRIDYDHAVAVQSVGTDEAIPSSIQSKYVPNFGTGVYYTSSKVFLGFSAPRLLQNNIDLADESGIISRETRHFYFIGGFVTRLSDKLKLQPQVLLKAVKGAPFDGDLNINLVFVDKFTGGISYRMGGSKSNNIGESVSLLVAAQISNNLLFGISYDATMSELRKFNSGSVEAMFKYFIKGKSQEGEPVNSRFF